MRKNAINSGADIRSSAYNKGRDNLTLGKGQTQGLDDTTKTC